MRPPANPGASPHAPSILLPLRFLVSGVLAALVAMGFLLARPDILSTYHYNQYVIAVTHLVVLGFILTAVMGAMYQLVPVALETKLYSERLARIHFVLHLLGVAGMVWMFWKWDMKQVGHFGTILSVGILLFLYNLARTLLRVPRWGVVATAVIAALVWLGLAALAGLTLAAGKASYHPETIAAWYGPIVGAAQGLASLPRHFDAISAMHAHAHLGAIGVFLMLIVGISFKLIPMFTLSELQSPRRAGAALLLLNLGLAGSFYAVLTRAVWKPIPALVIVLGLVVYGVELRAMLRARQRRGLDWGVRTFVTGVVLLIPVGACGLVLSWPGLPLNVFTGQLENAYGFLAFFGVVSLAIIGMLYKILPFLIWYRRYSSLIGKTKVPALSALYSARLQAISYFVYLSGIAITTGGILASHAMVVRSGCSLLAAGLGLLGANLWLMLRHLAGARTAPPQPAPRLAPQTNL